MATAAKSPANIFTDVKTLRAFARVSLAPGETKKVPLRVPVADLAYYDVASSAFVTEAQPLTGVAIVASWPARFRGERAARLGLTPDPDFGAVIDMHLAETAR